MCREITYEIELHHWKCVGHAIYPALQEILLFTVPYAASCGKGRGNLWISWLWRCTTTMAFPVHFHQQIASGNLDSFPENIVQIYIHTHISIQNMIP